MKILMVNKFLYSRGGCENYMLFLSDHLKKLGHEVEFFGMYDEKNNSAELIGRVMDEDDELLLGIDEMTLGKLKNLPERMDEEEWDKI